MSKLSELAYDIEQLYIEGYNPKTIAMMLECPVDMIYDWLESESLDVADLPQDDLSPFSTINS